MTSIRKQMNFSKERYQNNIKQGDNVLNDPMFKVGDNLKAEYDMWSWIYQEIANIRLEVSRLGTYVRVNKSFSPGFLEAYHAHIYSLIIPISVVLSEATWIKFERMWLECKDDITEYLNKRKNIQNAMIPFTLIRKLDKLYRIALLVGQKAGLGFKVSKDLDVEKAIENAIAGY